MTELALIGGTGLTSLKNLDITRREVVHTPYGTPSAPLIFGTLCGKEVVFLARHGTGHTIPPHMINYRANIWALRHLGIKKVIAIAAVGGITSEMGPETLVIPDQIIDYTWSRSHTFFEERLTEVVHVDFTEPYCQELREILISAGDLTSLKMVKHGTYGAMQGPRLESAAEIDRLERDGCHIVGMTGMPEVALARELDLCYATCAVVANWAAGRGNKKLTMKDINQTLDSGMEKVRTLLEQITPLL